MCGRGRFPSNCCVVVYAVVNDQSPFHTLQVIRLGTMRSMKKTGLQQKVSTHSSWTLNIIDCLAIFSLTGDFYDRIRTCSLHVRCETTFSVSFLSLSAARKHGAHYPGMQRSVCLQRGWRFNQQLSVRRRKPSTISWNPLTFNGGNIVYRTRNMSGTVTYT